MSAPTPTPWTWEAAVKPADKTYRRENAFLSPGILVVQEHFPLSPENARLIAAAANSYGKLPDPLAAAEGDLLGACMALVDYIVRNADNSGAETATSERARALLAKTKA